MGSTWCFEPKLWGFRILGIEYKRVSTKTPFVHAHKRLTVNAERAKYDEADQDKSEERDTTKISHMDI